MKSFSATPFPSNIVSRQVSSHSPARFHSRDFGLLQPGQSADGESGYADDAMEEDELINEAEDDQVCK